MKTKHAAPLAALALFAVACADPTSSDISRIGSNLPSLDFATNPVDPSTGLLVDNLGMPGGQVQVCKTTPAGDPGIQWSFTVTVTSEDGVTPITNSSPTIQGVSGQTVCTTVYTSATPGNDLDRVTVTEGALPADWSLTHLHVDLYQDGPNYQPVTQAGANAIVATGDLTTRTATSYVNADMQRIFTFTNDYTAPPVGNEGCTPGYWKQDHHFDSWTNYAPGDDFDTVFGVDFFNPDITLLDALNLGGDKTGINQLARHATAALLNAASGDVNSPMTEAEVIAAVQGATPATYQSVKNTLAANNELGCPLN
jgi:hypothetical protein